MLKSIFAFFLIMVLLGLLFIAYFAFRFWAMIKAIVNGSKQTNTQAHSSRQNSANTSSQSTTSTSSHTQGKKIFSADEGEYVEFEEVP